MQLEFAALGARTANDTYATAARRALDALLHVPRNGAAQKSHVLPVDVHPQRKRFESDRRSIGASGDSYYEYLLKGWLVARRGDDRPWARSLLQRSVHTHLAFVLGANTICSAKLHSEASRNVKTS